MSDDARWYEDGMFTWVMWGDSLGLCFAEHTGPTSIGVSESTLCADPCVEQLQSPNLEIHPAKMAIVQCRISKRGVYYVPVYPRGHGHVYADCGLAMDKHPKARIYEVRVPEFAPSAEATEVLRVEHEDHQAQGRLLDS